MATATKESGVVGAASEVGRFGIPSALTSHAQAGPLTARAEVIRGTERAIETTLAKDNMVVGAERSRDFGSNGELERSEPGTTEGCFGEQRPTDFYTYLPHISRSGCIARVLQKLNTPQSLTLQTKEIRGNHPGSIASPTAAITERSKSVLPPSSCCERLKHGRLYRIYWYSFG